LNIKIDDYLKYIIVYIDNTSNRSDLLQCYKIGIAGYFTKPLKYDEYVDRVTKLVEYWSTNELITN
jgi:DNA-binding NarL/FixJ family response regulator